MAYEIKVPPAGESITESTIAQWLKADGDFVRKGEDIVVLDTEKASAELQAESDGVLRIEVQAGKDVTIGAVIGRIDAAAAAPSAPASASASNGSGAASPSAPAGDAGSTRSAADDDGKGVQPPTGEEIKQAPMGGPLHTDVSSNGASAPPPAAALAATRPAAPRPAAVAAAAPAAPSYTPTGPHRREPMTRMRRTVAAHLLRAKQETAMLTTFAECDMGAVMAMRSKHQEAFQKKHGVKLGFMSFFIKAATDALKAFPLLNASIDSTDIVHHEYYNMSVAVSTEKGLVVPVLRDTDKRSHAEIEKELIELGKKAREGKIALDDLKGGTFTITNGGVFGSMLSTPLLNPPQVGILGMHNIVERPMAVNGKVEIRPMMYLALSYDHRLIDGKDAVQFLVHVRDHIATPELSMIGL